jgi:hypothetical protein
MAIPVATTIIPLFLKHSFFSTLFQSTKYKLLTTANFADAKFACSVCLKKSLPATGGRTYSINELTKGESRNDFKFLFDGKLF